MKTERKWKNYYRSAGKQEEEPCPIEEKEKVLQHGNSASATPALHCHAASRERNRKNANKQDNLRV
jgi:hypothetical protein